MTYYVVAPGGRGDKYSNATIVSEHSTPEDAYEDRDLLADVLQSSVDPVTGFYVVDEQRQPVPRPAAALRTRWPPPGHCALGASERRDCTVAVGNLS